MPESYPYDLFDPATIRSRFAAFDPAKRDSANLLAAMVGGPPVPLLQAIQDRHKQDLHPSARKQDRIRS